MESINLRPMKNVNSVLMDVTSIRPRWMPAGDWPNTDITAAYAK